MRTMLLASLLLTGTTAFNCGTERRQRPIEDAWVGDADDVVPDGDGDLDVDVDGDGDVDVDGDVDGDGDGDVDVDVDGDGDLDGDVDGDPTVYGQIDSECVTGYGDLWSVELSPGDQLHVVVDTVAPETASDLWAFISFTPPPDAEISIRNDDSWDCTFPPVCGYRGLCPELEGRAERPGIRYIFVGLVGTEGCCTQPAEYSLSVTIDGRPRRPAFVADDVYAEAP